MNIILKSFEEMLVLVAPLKMGYLGGYPLAGIKCPLTPTRGVI